MRMFTAGILGVAWLLGVACAAWAEGTGSVAGQGTATAAADPGASPAPVLAETTVRPASPVPTREVEKLLRAGVDERVVLLFITNTPAPFRLNPDQIIELKRAGASARVLGAMLWHDERENERRAAEDSAGWSGLPGGPLAPGSPGSILTAAGEYPSILTAPYPPPGGPPIVALPEPGSDGAPLCDEVASAPEQPADVGPVRLPYAVKLNDPIRVLKLPTFSVPYW